MSNQFSPRRCPVCDRMISNSGRAWVSHMRKHVRQSEVTETYTKETVRGRVRVQHTFVKSEGTTDERD